MAFTYRPDHDPRHLYFERRSGLPLGYFDADRHRRRCYLILTGLAVELVVAISFIAWVY